MVTTKTASTLPTSHGQGLRTYYQGKIEEYEVQIREKQVDLRRMEAQRNELNSKGTSFTGIPGSRSKNIE